MDFKEIVYRDINTREPKEEVKIVKTGQRHAIKVSDIFAKRINYQPQTVSTKNLIVKETDRIAIFANEYIPNHFPAGEWVSYKLTVNGRDYKISPINSHREEAKIIKYAKYDDGEPHAIVIKEVIKEAFLTITINTPNSFETPFVSNLKVVTGKES